MLREGNQEGEKETIGKLKKENKWLFSQMGAITAHTMNNLGEKRRSFPTLEAIGKNIDELGKLGVDTKDVTEKFEKATKDFLESLVRDSLTYLDTQLNIFQEDQKIWEYTLDHLQQRLDDVENAIQEAAGKDIDTNDAETALKNGRIRLVELRTQLEKQDS